RAVRLVNNRRKFYTYDPKMDLIDANSKVRIIGILKPNQTKPLFDFIIPVGYDEYILSMKISWSKGHYFTGIGLVANHSIYEKYKVEEYHLKFREVDYHSLDKDVRIQYHFQSINKVKV
ncbi:MAG: hypothetical protein C0490_10660, partial [Marivirga sp.]|nr:hypothetical protein [Marivirga sp.]